MNRLPLLLAFATMAATPLAVTRVQANGAVVFNEIMYHPATNEAVSEWIELKNLLAVDVDISDWTLGGMVEYRFPSNSIIRGGQHLVVALVPGVVSAQFGLANVYGPFTGRLNNAGGALRLQNNSGRVVDELQYGSSGDWPVAPDGAGLSLAKRDPDSASGPSGNWTGSAQMGGTPGAGNFPGSGFAAPPGLVSYWPFNEPAGSAVGDQTGANPGTLGSAVTRTASSLGGALAFNGASNAFVNLGSSPSFNAGIGLTIETVLQPGWSTTNTAVLFRKAPSRPPAYRDAVLGSSPIAYWRLGDNTSTISDSGPNGRTGTASGGVLLSQPSLIPSDPGNTAMRFGDLDRITVSGFEKIGPGGYTVEFWVRPHVLPASCCQNLVGDGEAGSDYFLMNYLLGPQQGLVGAIRPHFGPANSPVSLSGTTGLQVNNTYHVVTTWDTSLAANNAIIYINGQPSTVGTISRNLPAPGTTGANTVYIGHDDRGTTDGAQTIDEVALYNRPISAADVAAHYEAGILANFDVNQGNAIQLAFQDDGNNAAANPAVAPGKVLSFGLTVGGVYSELDMPLDGAAGRPTLAQLQNGQPHHVAATFDSATGLKAIFIDGVLRFSTTLAGGLNGTNTATAVAGNAAVNGAAPLTGTLDELAYWNRALSASEVAAHWASVQAGRDYFTQPDAGASARLAFNEWSASTNASFWLELVNYGANSVALPGFVIVRDGAAGANGEYVFPAGRTLAAGAYLALTNTTLGFQPVDGDRLFLLTPARDRVLDAVVITRGPRARVPAGTGAWLRPTTATPGGANQVTLRDEIVINEIMFSPKLLPSTNGLPPRSSPERWVEIYNKSSNAVDLSGWEFDGGIQYRFTAGQVLAPGGYLVVARDAASLRAKFPGVPIVGDFGGTLSGRSDRLVLADPAGNPADEVRYYNGGRWPEYAAGGGSSLELRDPGADNAKAEAWAASIESSNTAWQTVSYRMLANVPTGSGQPTTWNDFVIGLQESGECLIDDLSVIETPATTPVQLLANTNFDAGLAGWRILGTHNQSRVIPEPGNPGNNVLHLISTGPQEHMHNHIESTFTSGRTVVNGREYQVSYRVRWLAGSSLLNTRLYFNRVARTTELNYPTANGTPGRRNSRWEANAGPTFAGFAHTPIAPQPGAPVTVTVTAQDPQGVAGVELWWSVNSGTWTSAAMASGGAGLLTGSIPGGAVGDVVQFYVRAVDSLGASATYPARGPNSGALYKVSDGQANLALSHNVRVIVTPAIANVMHGTAQGVAQTNVMSNELYPCTIVYDESRAYYDCGVHLRGSQRGRYSDVRTGFHIEFPPDDLFRGVHPTMLVDRSGAGDATANRQEEIILKHMLNRAGGLPGTYGEIARVIAPRSAHTGPCQFFPRHEDAFMENAFGDGGDGTQFEMELIYYPTTADAGGYKQPQPDNVIGTDLTDLGADKEIYRYNFMIKNQRSADDYRDFILFCKTLSLSGAQLESQIRQIMDVNQWMRAYAMVSLGAVGDMYSFGNNHNFFTYQRATDRRFVYMPWDMDFTFTRGASGALVGDQNIAKVVNLPANLRCLYAHMLDIIGTCFNTSYMSYWTAHYASFAPGQSYAGHLSTIGSRASFVQSTINSAGGNSPFAITSPTNVVSTTNLILISGTAPVTAHTLRVNGREYPITWTSISAWTLRIPVSEALQVLNITGYDLRGQPLTNFSRTVTVSYTGASPDPAGLVALNEIMYNPLAPDASYVELINTSTNFNFDLSGWRLNGLDYTFPAGSVLASRGILVLARSAAGYALAYGTGVPAPFDTYNGSLDNDGETLTLFRPGPTPGSEVVVDKVRYEPLSPWPARANGLGASLQAIDATQDNARVANWSDGSGWRFYSVTASSGPGLSTAFSIFLANAGELYVDNLSLVQGSSPTAGPNLLSNGSFEEGLASWGLLGNHSNSTVVTGISLSGSNSLRILASSVGAGTSSAVTQAVTTVVTNLPYTVSFWFLPSTSTATGINFRVTSSLRSLSAIDVRSGLPTPGTANSVATSLAAFPPLWLNEVQPVNSGLLLDGSGEAEPWIEIHNAGTGTVSLAGCYLSAGYGNLSQWAFPAGAELLPGQFRIVFCDGEPGEGNAGEWHASFRLSPTNGSVALSWSPGSALQLLDYLNYAALPAGRSYGAFPDGQPFDRQEFAVVTPGATNNNATLPLTVFINEWMADNQGTLINSNHNNQFDDWFELYNPTTSPADLRGYYLTDNPAQPTQFQIPAGYVLPPGGRLLVWADGRPDLNQPGDPALHAGFQLSRGGEVIGLLGGDGRLIDLVTFGEQVANLSQGRYPDGSASIYYLQAPTPGGANSAWINRRPVLPPIPDALAYVGFPLTINAAASDPDVPPQVLTYTLDPGAPTNAAVHPGTGQFSWTPLPAQSGSTNVLTLRVTDNGPLQLSDARTFTVIVRTGLVLGGITPGPAGSVSFTVGTLPGRTYRLQYKNSLAAAGWTDLPPDRVAASNSLVFTDTMGAQPQRFYRVVQVD